MPDQLAIVERKASSKQIVRYDRGIDSWRRYLTDAPTPEKLATYLKQVDQGDIAALGELQLEMEAKDAQLQGIAETRRMAVTALDWDIEPAPRAKEERAAKEAAEYCRDALNALSTWPDTLEHLQSSVGPNVAVAELVWARGELVKTVDVPCHRLMVNPLVGIGVWIETLEEWMGVYADRGKFITYHPNPQGGFPFRKTMTHATVVPWMAKNFCRTDWLAFVEVYGTPTLWAEYADEVADSVKEGIEDWLEKRGSDERLLLPNGVTLKHLLVDGKGDAFQSMIEWAEKVIAILYLGQTLTSDIGNVGSRAAAQVHDNVRLDLLTADLKKEARCIRDQVLRFMVELRFPDRDVPVPIFVRKLTQKKDVEGDRLGLEQIRMARELRLPIVTDEAYKRLGLTKPDVALPEVLEFEEPEQPNPEKGAPVGKGKTPPAKKADDDPDLKGAGQSGIDGDE